MAHLNPILFSTVAFLVYFYIPGSWAQVTLQSLQDQVNTLTLQYQNSQQQIGLINQQLVAQANQESSDVSALEGQIQRLSANYNAVQNQANSNTAGLNSLGQQVGAVEIALVSALQRIDRLEGVNKIWRSNFQIVNRTFIELRKKFKFAIPAIRLPAVYVVPVNNRNG